MENDERKDLSDTEITLDTNCSSVNKLILDYYKKFGRKRDIEQFFSLSTAQQDLSEPSSLFWKRMKDQNDSSDSGDKKTGSTTEVCRISIKCLVEDLHTSKDYKKNTDSDTESPPIISDDVPDKGLDSDGDSNKSDGEHSHKSVDMTLDTSLNRPNSPTSSITSQRKLEWDSLADVGYGNESDRKNSASSLSTLERLALHQQYSNNDTKQNTDLGPPTAHSTPLDQTESKSKVKKNYYRESSKFCKKDVDIMEVNIPNTNENTNQPINVNLTKHISFNVEEDGVVKVDNMTKKISVSRENSTSYVAPPDNIEKEVQTTLPRNSKGSVTLSTKDYSSRPRFPILINLNTTRKRKKKRKKPLSRPRKRELIDKENIPLEKSINQESDAESFEYMPGHIYNQNKLENKSSVLNVADNKSSLESSAGHSTESSKDLKCTFTKELEKSIELLKLGLQHRYKNASLKEKLIKEVVQSLVQTKYKSDESSNEFMLESNENIQTASSTSDSNNLENKKPKKSILRTEKFNSGEIATTSQSAPNLPTMSTTTIPDKPLKPTNVSSTDSEFSYKSKYLSEVFLANSSSEEIYKKYLIALKKENLYKKKLKEQELLLKQKITQPNDLVFQSHVKAKSNLDHLIKDLAKNNFADGSGDASNACPSSSNAENASEQNGKSHTVFTLSEGSNDFKRNKKLRNRLESEINSSIDASSNAKHECCSTYRHEKIVVTDSSVQVNFGNECMPKVGGLVLEPNTYFNQNKNNYENSQEDIKYVCFCPESQNEVSDNFLVYKCSRLPSKCILLGSNIKMDDCTDKKLENIDYVYNTYMCENNDLPRKKNSTTSTQSSQTHFSIPKLTLRNSGNKMMNSKGGEPRKIDSFEKTCNTYKVRKLTQTEISIHPKISDPSISDIQIIENFVYDDLDDEQEPTYNVNIKESNEVCKATKQSYAVNKDIKDSLSKDSLKEGKVFRSVKQKHLEVKEVSLQKLQPQSNFTIPIHGTNMTLKVSLGSKDFVEKITKDIKPANSQESLGSNDIETLKKVEKQYCILPTENLKRTSNVEIQTFDMREQKDIDDNIRICYSEIKDDQRPTTSAYRYNSVDMGYYNTYPKETTPKTPLLRSNTDTGKMEYCDPNHPHIDIKNVNAKEKSLSEPKYQVVAGELKCFDSNKLTKKTYFEAKETNGSANIYQHTVESMDKANECSKDNLSKKPLLKSKAESQKKEILDRHSSMDTNDKDSKNSDKLKFMDRYTSTDIENAESIKQTFDTDLRRSDVDEFFVQPISTDTKDKNEKERILNKKNTKSNNNSERKEFIDHHTSMGKENKNTKDRTFQKPLTQACKDSEKKDFFDRRTSMGKENENSKERTLKKPLTMACSDSEKKEFVDRSTSMGEENDSSKGPLRSNLHKVITDAPNNKKDVNTQYDSYLTTQIVQINECTTKNIDCSKSSNDTKDTDRKNKSSKKSKTQNSSSNTDDSKSSSQDPLLDIIRDITKRYTKKEIDKSKRKKCYAEIIAVLNYLLDTGDTTENENNNAQTSSTSEYAVCASKSPPKTKDKPKKTPKKEIIDDAASTHNFKTEKTFEDKSVQPSPRKSKLNKCWGESTDCPISTDVYSASTDSTACKLQHRTKHQCEKHHQCCKPHSKKYDISSSSSMNFDPCKHRCYCRGHRSHKSKTSEKNKKYVAYNLILQTSDSIASEEVDKQRVERQLKDIVVKVPSKRRVENMQFKEVTQKIERNLPGEQYVSREYRARNIPQDEVSSTDNMVRNTATCTIRDYLEQNRPDFVEKSSHRQNCLKLINEARPLDCDTHLKMIVVHPPTCVRNKMTSMYCEGVIDDVGCSCNECFHKLYCVQNEVSGVASERATKREVLSAHVARASVATHPSTTDLRRLAELIGKDMRTRKLAPKFISEKEMKKHSEKIYKSLPEVQRKKEEIKKERVKKTNLLMANIFKKNLQKKTLRGAVNLSNYSAVIKI